MAVTQEGFVEAEQGIRLYFRTVGEGEAVVIPLVCWTEEFDVLAQERRVIFYDPPTVDSPRQSNSKKFLSKTTSAI